MSLATRCPACNTVFRVVQDQLKVSGGWVRCGHCHEVFNGLEALFQLPPAPAAPEPEGLQAAPPSPPPPDAAPTPVIESAVEMETGADSVESRTPDEAAAFGGDDEPVHSLRSAGPHHLAGEPKAEPPLGREPVHSSLRPNPFVEARSRSDREYSFKPSGLAPDTTQQPEETRPAPERRRRKRRPKPAFVKQAERAAQWRRPAMRAVLGTTAAVLLLLLTCQIVLRLRDELCARWPVLRPPLLAWCSLAHCDIEPPRALAALTLDSSTLTQTRSPQTLRLMADLRNGADHPARAPAVELSFTDALGRLLARKVLLPEQLNAPRDGIAADQSWHIDVHIHVGDLRIASFRAEVFYP